MTSGASFHVSTLTSFTVGSKRKSRGQLENNLAWQFSILIGIRHDLFVFFVWGHAKICATVFFQNVICDGEFGMTQKNMMKKKGNVFKRVIIADTALSTGSNKARLKSFAQSCLV